MFVSLQQIISSLFVLCSAAAMAEGECPAECSCAPSPPLCPRGISWVTDHCGCCKVCAKQFNEDCSATEPCDHIKGLRCHLGAGGDPERGLCRADAQGLPCEFNGRMYQHGEHFQPSCQHQCTCMNRVVGCMPLCPHQVPLPDWRCSRPQLVRPDGGCCEEWVCDDDNHISEEPDEHTHTSHPDSRPLPNHISPVLQPQPLPRHPAATGGAAYRGLVKKKKRVVAIHRDEGSNFRIQSRKMLAFPVSQVVVESRCFLHTTEWSECSTTCGMGISARVTNDNPDCQLVRETRLCQIRQCDLQLPYVSKRGKKCQRTSRPQDLVRISFAGCWTAPRYRPRTCGACTDSRCCTPSLSRTVRLRFQCPDGESFYHNVQWIQRCSCMESCPRHAPSSPAISLYNDIHVFRH